MSRKLYRSSRDRVISGVLGGIADYLDISSSILRIVFVVIAIFADAFFFLGILYVLGILFIPVDNAPLNNSTYQYHRNPNDFLREKDDFIKNVATDENKIYIGIALIALGVLFLVNTLFSIPREYILAVLMILLGIYMIFKHDKGGK